MNDEQDVGQQAEESAASVPSEAQSGKEARDKSDALEIEIFIEDRERELPRWGELIGVFCLIVLCDLTIYRGAGFAGYALLFLVAPLLLWLSSIRRCRGPGLWIVSAMLAALSFKMVWCGSIALTAVGLVVGQFNLISVFWVECCILTSEANPRFLR